MIFQGAKFCSHCGARVTRSEIEGTATRCCPRCKENMQSVTLGKTGLRECARCEGLWLDKASFEHICVNAEEQSAVLGAAGPLLTDYSGNVEKEIRYLPCPACARLMNRVNFAHCSHVIVDVCMQHGTWFDKDELRRIVEFIRGGGIDKARAIEIEELKRQRQQLASARTSTAMDASPEWHYSMGWPGRDYDLVDVGVSAAAMVIRSLFK
jgi:Zn-finger nucleic acid-binding protein